MYILAPYMYAMKDVYIWSDTVRNQKKHRQIERLDLFIRTAQGGPGRKAIGREDRDKREIS